MLIPSSIDNTFMKIKILKLIEYDDFHYLMSIDSYKITFSQTHSHCAILKPLSSDKKADSPAV